MSATLLKARMALELPAVERSIRGLLEEIPAPARAAASHTVSAGGKRLRPLLAILSAKLFGAADGEPLRRLASTLELLHAATLMHDDVVDGAATRRGSPSAHVLFGTTRAILAGDALLSAANACVATYGSPALCEVFARATAETAAGEILELDALRDPELPAEAYEAVIRGKTARLIRAACEMGAIYAGAGEAGVAAMGTYGEALGMAFQMVDDALDFADPALTGKPAGGDLREGKLTPPLKLYRDSLDGPGRADFDARFSAGAFGEEEAALVGARIRELGIDGAVRRRADAFLSAAREALSDLPDRPERALLVDILAYVRDRRN